jgi:hypothetical protein
VEIITDPTVSSLVPIPRPLFTNQTLSLSVIVLG